MKKRKEPEDALVMLSIKVPASLRKRLRDRSEATGVKVQFLGALALTQMLDQPFYVDGSRDETAAG